MRPGAPAGKPECFCDHEHGGSHCQCPVQASQQCHHGFSVPTPPCRQLSFPRARIFQRHKKTQRGDMRRAGGRCGASMRPFYSTKIWTSMLATTPVGAPARPPLRRRAPRTTQLRRGAPIEARSCSAAALQMRYCCAAAAVAPRGAAALSGRSPRSCTWGANFGGPYCNISAPTRCPARR